MTTSLQIIINAVINPNTVLMVPLVNGPGHPPDVIAQIAPRETGVGSAQRGSKVMSVTSVPPDFKEMDATNVQKTTTEMIVVKILFRLFSLFLTPSTE